MSAFELLTYSSFWLAALAAAWLAFGGKWGSMSRRGALLGGGYCVAAVSAEYWILGPYSFAHIAVDVDISMSSLLYAATAQDIGKFSFAYVGGNDVAGMLSTMGQFFSLERLLLSLLPLWPAIVVHKVSAFALSYVGTYLLARRCLGASRAAAIAMGVFYLLAHESLSRHSWTSGFGYQIIPLAIYLAAGRLGRPRYWLGVVAAAGINAVSCTPTNSFMCLLPALVLGALALGWRQALRVFPAVLLFMLFVALNWHESIHAKVQLSPYFFRSQEVKADLAFSGLLLYAVKMYWPSAVLGVAGVLLLAWSRRPETPRIALAVSAAAFGGAFFTYLPWNKMGLGFLAAYNFNYMSYAITVLGPVAVGLAAARGKALAARFALVAVMALAAGQFAQLKVSNLLVWLSEGGLPVVTNAIDTMRALPKPDQPVRTFTVPYRLPINLAAVAGWDAIDGSLSLGQTNAVNYWGKGIILSMKERKGRYFKAAGGYHSISSTDFDGKCCAEIELSRFADLDLLRAANVRYVFSVLPLSDPELKLVAGEVRRDLPRNTDPLATRLSGYASFLFDPAPIGVYEIENPAPRLYALKSVFRLEAGATDEQVMAAIARHAADGTGVVRAATPDLPTGDARILESRFEADRVAVVYSAAAEASLVLNVPYNPFWRATVDGESVPVLEVNQIQMAAVVPQGGRELVFQYQRPTLREKIASLLRQGKPSVPGE